MQQNNDPSQLFIDELEKRRGVYAKALDQGEKINNLTENPDWQFFEEWILSVRKGLNDRVVGENFIRDHNGYLFTVGAIRAVDQILKGVETFKRKYVEAGTKMQELSKEMDRIKREQ